MYEFMSGMGTNGKDDAPPPASSLPNLPNGPVSQQQLDEFMSQCAQQPEVCAAAGVPLCAIIELPFGAIIGALASPKGERGGGAKWGALAAAATCPLNIVVARLGVFGSVFRWGLAIAAPIAAAKWRLGWRP